MGDYLIPANSKKSLYIFGLFEEFPLQFPQIVLDIAYNYQLFSYFVQLQSPGAPKNR